MSEDPLAQARSLLAEMKTQAEDGSMIPRRVPGQIAEVQALLDSLAAPAATAAASPAAGDGSAAASEPGGSAEVQAILDEYAKLFSVVVHELRKPMTSLQGYSDMLSKQIAGPLNDMQSQFVAVIHRNVLEMNHLLVNIGYMTKLKTGHLHLDQRMELGKNIIDGSQKEMSKLAEQREQTLTYDTAGSLPLVNADTDKVTHALNELVRNALLYSPQGSTVTVAASNDGGKLRVTVTDSGIGLTDDDKACLGEAFWRADHETVQAEKGYGVGYYVAQGIIALHGGEVFYESTFEQGSTFGFWLPGLS